MYVNGYLIKMVEQGTGRRKEKTKTHVPAGTPPEQFKVPDNCCASSPRRRLTDALALDRDASLVLEGRQGSSSLLPEIVESDDQAETDISSNNGNQTPVSRKDYVRCVSRDLVGGIISCIESNIVRRGSECEDIEVSNL